MTQPAPEPTSQPYRVFAYGSLLWDPGFPHVGASPAKLIGYHRAFCLYSYRYRGTRENPGLVLALARGGSCRGVVYQVAPEHVAETKAYLWEREMSGGSYVAKTLPVVTPAGRVPAQTFVADPTAENYAGGLPDEAIARLIANGRGARGACVDYLDRTLDKLIELGVPDPRLARLRARVRDMAALQSATPSANG